MGKHALLNASSAHRWLTCPPLPRLENFFEKEVSEVANEGTDAHRLSEYKLRKVLGEKVRKPKLKYFDKDMDNYIVPNSLNDNQGILGAMELGRQAYEEEKSK